MLDKILSITTLLLMILMVWIECTPKPKPIAPDIHMMTECDSFVTSVHILNLDKKPIRYSYKVYIDTNYNSLVDSSDILLASEPLKSLGVGQENMGMKLKPLHKYKSCSLIAQVTTDDLVAYYASIPCDRGIDGPDPTPTK